MTGNNKDSFRVSIQVGLSGYSFKVYDRSQVYVSRWMSAEKIFTTREFQQRYDEVDISVFTHKFALVPEQFYVPENANAILGDVVSLKHEDKVDAVRLPQYASVLLYSNDLDGTLPRVIAETVLRTDGTKAVLLPEVYYMLNVLQDIQSYNKILASYMDGYLHLVIAQGKTLLLCNSFAAPDFTTALYFIFLAMKKMQLNPEVSSIFFRTALSEEQEMSLYRYFKNVEQI